MLRVVIHLKRLDEFGAMRDATRGATRVTRCNSRLKYKSKR